VTLVLLAPAIAVLLLCLGAWSLRAQHQRQLQLLGHVVSNDAAEGSRPVPALLFFSSATCAVCHTAQRPAVDALTRRLEAPLSIREIDVAEEPDVSRRYRVMSLPTTVILRCDGTVAAINVGFASTDKLMRQLADVSVGVSS
jgi:thioredoxin-like negative regulator of GroEL